MALDTSLGTNPQFVSVDLARQLLPGTFEPALHQLLDYEVDLAHGDARFQNDTTGAPAYPRTRRPYCSRWCASPTRRASCAVARSSVSAQAHVTFMARCGMTAPHFTTIAHFVRTLRDDIAQLFAAVLAVCDGQGLIGREMLAIDGVKLSSDASKHRSGTRAEFTQRAEKLEKAAQVMLDRHRATEALERDRAHCRRRLP